MTTGTHEYSDDPRNAEILDLRQRRSRCRAPRRSSPCSIPASSSATASGKGCALIEGGIAFLDAHLDRLYEGAKAIDMDVGLTGAALTERLFACLARQRDARRRPYPPDGDARHQAHALPGPARHHRTRDGRHHSGIQAAEARRSSRPASRLFTVHVRRTGPAEQDQKLNSHSKLNCILACIQAAKAGADEALMLDPAGFVATCNSTHFFIVRKGEVWTSPPDYCLGGITRGNVLEAARDAGIPALEKRFSLTDVYGADEAFVTGTFAGLVPVREVDGRTIG